MAMQTNSMPLILPQPASTWLHISQLAVLFLCLHCSLSECWGTPCLLCKLAHIMGRSQGGDRCWQMLTGCVLLVLLQGRAATLTRSVLHSSDGVVMLLDARCVRNLK
jgi:hypothetical protein